MSTAAQTETPHISGEVVRFSSAALPERDRIAVFREFLGRKLMRVEIEPLADHPFEADVTVRKWPGLDFISATRSPLRVGRTKALLTDGDDRLVFQIDDYPSVVSHGGAKCRSMSAMPSSHRIAIRQSVLSLRQARSPRCS